jgi:hypothetical protein
VTARAPQPSAGIRNPIGDCVHGSYNPDRLDPCSQADKQLGWGGQNGRSASNGQSVIPSTPVHLGRKGKRPSQPGGAREQEGAQKTRSEPPEGGPGGSGEPPDPPAAFAPRGARVHDDVEDGLATFGADAGVVVYPGRKPRVWGVKRPARPCKSAVQTRVTVGSAKGA